MGIQLNKCERIIYLSWFCKIGERLKKQLNIVLKNISIVEIKNIKFHLCIIKFLRLLVNEIKIEHSRKIPPIGNAEGKKKIPNKKSFSPKWSLLLDKFSLLYLLLKSILIWH